MTELNRYDVGSALGRLLAHAKLNGEVYDGALGDIALIEEAIAELPDDPTKPAPAPTDEEPSA